jgi:hypothetical protein
MDDTSSVNIAVLVVPQANGRYICKLRSPLAGETGAVKAYHGQTANHAIANALEDLALALRVEVEAGQNVDWDAVDRSLSGKVIDRHFHVISHYECLVEEESKFDAVHNTLNGNTVEENAELTILQVDPDFPKLAWKRRV